MANEPEKVDSGIFIDTKSGDIVYDKPEEGVQIVPEGGVLDDAAKGRLKAEEDAGASVVAPAEASDDKTVTSKSARGK